MREGRGDLHDSLGGGGGERGSRAGHCGYVAMWLCAECSERVIGFVCRIGYVLLVGRSVSDVKGGSPSSRNRRMRGRPGHSKGVRRAGWR